MLPLDGVYDGVSCMSLGTWHGYTCVESISAHVRVRTCEVVFVRWSRCGHKCEEAHVDILVSSLALHVWE